jgi:hypothetical protein
MSDDRLRRNPEAPAAPASANPFPPSRSPGLFDGGQFNWVRSRHGDVYGVLGGGRLINEFRQGTLARLQLPHHRPSSAATVSVSPATPNASASSLSGSWV